MIANSLAREKRYEVLFLSLVEQKETVFFPLEPGIRRYTLGKKWIQPGPGYLGVLPKLRRFFREQKPDVVIDIDIVLDVLSLPAAKGTGTKVVSWEHFNYFFEQESLYRRMILRYSVKRTDYIVTLTEEDRTSYRKYLNRKEHISAIYNPMEAQKPLAHEEKEKWIVTVGRLIHRKGTDLLAQIAPPVLKAHRDWKWYVLGEGEDRPILEEAIRAHDLSGQLILTGTVSNVEDYLEKAQIFVMTSRTEGLPMCLLEAKTNRLPCVSFDIQTGPKEIIAHEKNGYLIPAFDCRAMEEKIETLIRDDGLRAAFSERTDLDTEKFGMTSIMKNWNGVLDDLCGYRKH